MPAAGDFVRASDILSEDAFIPFTPTWTGITVGNAVDESCYYLVGKIVVVRYKLTLGSTSTVTGSVTQTLPVTPAATTTNSTKAVGMCRDASVPTSYHVILMLNAASAQFLRFQETHTAINATVPFTWAVSDIMAGQLVYEAA